MDAPLINRIGIVKRNIAQFDSATVHEATGAWGC